MAKQTIDIGVQGNDGTGDSIRESFRKVNENFNEIYAIFGVDGVIGLTDLGDTPLKALNPALPISPTNPRTRPGYDANQLIMANGLGSRLSARTLTAGSGINIEYNSDDELTIKATVGKLNQDFQPSLIAPLNANDLPIGKVRDPDSAALTLFNSTYGGSPLANTDSFAVPKGYADNRYVIKDKNLTNNKYYLPDALRTRNEPTSSETSDPDYDGTLTGNYLSTEVLPRKSVVYRGGDTMTGKLYLSDHPAPLAGAGIQTSADDLQAATKYYVDNNTFSSNVNLFVTTSGDDLQTKAPPGKEGRFWQYAYRSIGAAALAAENLITLASQEPGPYRQRIAYTIGPDQTFSTISSVVLVNGYSTDPAYQAAYNLLQANKQFIQAETIAYINNKYVNTFTYDKAKYNTDIQNAVEAVANDLVFDTTYNSFNVGAKYFNEDANKILPGQLTQTIDAIKFARDQVLGYAYSSTGLNSYIDVILDSVSYDLVFSSNYQSISAGHKFSSANTALTNDQIEAVLNNLLGTTTTPNTILNIPEVANSSSIQTTIKNSFSTIINLIKNGTIPTLVYGTTASTTTGQVNAKTLLLENIDFIQAELISYLSAEYPNLPYNRERYKADISKIVKSLVFDFMYGGNKESVYVGNSYWNGAVRTIADIEVAPVVAMIGYINTLAQAIVTNTSPAIVYQQTIRQYRNESLAGGGTVSTSISNNIISIASIVNQHSVIAVVNPTIPSGTTANIRTAMTVTNAGTYKTNANTFVDATYPVISDNGILTTINSKFQVIIDILTLGISNLNVQYPIYTNPNGASTSAFDYARLGLQANLDFIASEAIAKGEIENPSYTYGTLGQSLGRENAKRIVKRAISAISYDITYGTTTSNAATVDIAKQFWVGNLSSWPAGADRDYITDVLDKAQDLAVKCSTNTLETNLLASTSTVTATIIGTTLNSSTVTIVPPSPTAQQFVVGNIITTSASGAFGGLANSTTYFITAVTSTTITLAAYNTGTNTVGAAFTATSTATGSLGITTNNTRVRQNNIAGNPLASSASATINSRFNTIKDILNSLSNVPTIVYPSDVGYNSTKLAAKADILSGKTAVANDTIVFLDSTYTGGFAYDESLCYRDIGLIIDAMSIDLITGGTYQSIFAGKSYYKNASAKAIAIGTQYSETLDGINFTYALAIQVLNKSIASRYQILVPQITTIVGGLPTTNIGISGVSGSANTNSSAVTTFSNNMDIMIGIIKNGIGAAPVASFGTGIWKVSVTNGGTGAVDQGKAGNNDIIPAKVIVGFTSNAYASIVKYIPGNIGGTGSVDVIEVRKTKPGFFVTNSMGVGGVGEQLEFGETVQATNITIFVESGIYYEDYPIRLPNNVSIKGDEFRRTIIRPRDRISQSPWRKIFFYRDAVIDAMQIGLIDTSTNYANSSSITLDGTTNQIVITLGTGQVPSAWIGKILQVSYADQGSLVVGESRIGKAVIDSVSGNFMNCSVIYPFYAKGTVASPKWKLYDGINYARHYLSNPLDINSPAKNNKEIDVFLCNDAVRVNNVTIQGHGGFAMVLDPEGQIKTKSPYGQVCSSFSQSNNNKRFAGGQFVDGFAGRLKGYITNIAYDSITNLSIAPLSAGTGYTNGVYTNVALANTGTASGVGATAQITVVGGVVDSVAITAGGAGYKFADILEIDKLSATVPAGLLTGTGFKTSVASTSGTSNGITVTIVGDVNSGLDFRPPQPPCAFYVNGYRYQIDDIVSHNPTTRTVVVTMNVDTPYNALGSYNNVKCSRDVGYILDAVGYDIVTGSNYQSIKSGLAYQRSSAANVAGGQKTSTIAGIQKARDLALLQTNTSYRSLQTLNNSTLVGGSNYVPASGVQTYPNVPLTPYTVSVKGTGATATIVVTNGSVTSVTVTPGVGGSNYKVGDILTASNASLGGSGTGFRITVATISADTSIDTAIINRFDTVSTILDQGINGAPTITYPTPSAGSDTNLNKARDILIANRTFIQNEISAYIADTTTLKSYPAYKSTTLQTYVGNVLNAIIYDIYYGGNSQTIDVAESFYYRNTYISPTTNTNLFGTNLETIYQSAFTRLKAILGNIVAGTSISITAGNTETQITTNAPAAGAILTAVQTKLNTLSDYVIDYVYDGQFTATSLSSVVCAGTAGQFTCTSSSLYLGQYVYITGTLTGNVTGLTVGQTYYIIATNGTTSFTLSSIPNGPAITTSGSTTTGLTFNIKPVVTYPDIATGATGYSGVTYTYDTGLKTARTTINTNKATTQSGVINYLNNGADLLINIEMGGNKSMLANDFAMINDLGYAIVCTNGAVSEQVSTFTYYCHTHYWSNNGGQIRSVAGSNAHGTYGLRASGYDVTEVPDAVTLANNMVQTARVYKQGIFANEMTPTATQQALSIYVADYSYNPMGSSELEIDHSIADPTVGTVRYEVKSVEYTTVSINGKSILKLNLSTTGNNGTSSTGLVKALYHGQLVVLRTLTKNKFNGIANVNPTRPSTALQYNEDLADIYRILAYGLADSTGEILPSNVAVLESDSSFDYYKFIIDVNNIVKPDPSITPVTATINAGSSVSSTTITVSSASGAITQGMGVWVESGGIVSGQFVVNATNTGGSNWTIVLNKPPTSVPTTNAVIKFSTKTQGSLPGDDKVSVLEVTQTSIINQINKGIYILGWGGRVFRIKEYVVPQYIASANTFVDWGIAGTNKLRIQVVTGNIEVGDIIQYTSGGNLVQFVDGSSNPITVSNVTSSLLSGVLTYEVTFSATPTVLPALGNAPFVFGVAYSGYLKLDPNAIDNNSSEGNSISALTYISSVAGVASGSRIVTYEIPFTNSIYGSVTPVVDSYANILGNTLAIPYNGYYQISGITDQTVVSVPSVDGLVTGMVVSVNTVTYPGAIVPPSTIIQSIDTISKTITVSPACWIPSGTTISATIYAYVTSISGPLPTTTFGDPGLLEVRIGTVTSGGTAGTVVQAKVKANTQLSGNVYTITGWTIISPGFGYTSAPSVKLFYNNVEVTTALTAVMSATATNAVTSTGGVISRNISVYYPRDPGVTGNLVQVANSGNLITLDSVTGLDVNNRIIFYKTSTGSDIGNIVTGVTYYIKTIDTLNKNITVSTTITNGVAGTAFVPVNTGTLSGTMTYHSPDYGVPTTVTINSASVASSTTVNGTVTYNATFTLGTNFTSVSGNWYYISGSSNPLFNGLFQATATNTNNTTLVVKYPSNPGTFAGTASVYYDPTNATSNKRGLGVPFSTGTSSTLRIGYPADISAQITVRISTCRASGHDFLDIGTGSYSTTNYPYTIYGNPAQSRQPQNEVKEDGVGRVFYVTTDQNGIFRVGRFFTVDQGTGTVTFSASIALSNLDGLGFKRGVVVSEFSTDSSMTNNAPDTVSTQSAVRGYIDKRLGLDHSGGVLAVSNLIGPGYMALNGALSMKGNMVMGAFKITQLGDPTEGADATNKSYVDAQIASFDQFRELRDTEFSNPANGQIAVYDTVTSVSITNAQGTGTTGTLWFNVQASAPFTPGKVIVVTGVGGVPAGANSYNGEKIVISCTTTTVTFACTQSDVLTGLTGTATATKWRNITLPDDNTTSDVLLTYSSATGKFTSAIQAGKITNNMVSATAAIVQSKLSMTVASARTETGGSGTAGAIVQADLGLATFNSGEFTVNAQGWVKIKDNSIAYSKIAKVAKDSVLGNKSTTATTDATEVSMSSVVRNGNGLQNSLFTTAGVLVLDTATNGNNESGTTLTGYDNTYSTLGYTTTREANKLLKTNADGAIDVAYLKVDDKKILDISGTTLEFTTPGGYVFATSLGTQEDNTTTTFKGNLSVIDNNSKITVKQLTSGAATGTGSAATLTGQWQLSADSALDLATNNNVLKVRSITAGDESTTGQITGRWSLIGSSTLQATYADLAEYYEGDQEYEPGTVLVFGGDKEVTTTKIINDTRAAGVVTTNPAYVMNQDQKGLKVCLALAGRVPCKVVGRVKKGDMLTTSATLGYAVKALNPTLGSIIGKALEDKDYGEAGVIQIAVGRL